MQPQTRTDRRHVGILLNRGAHTEEQISIQFSGKQEIFTTLSQRLLLVISTAIRNAYQSNKNKGIF